MIYQPFLDNSICLLERIESSQEMKMWCRTYSSYSSNTKLCEIEQELDVFFYETYKMGLVITNYHQVIEQYSLNEADIIVSSKHWLDALPYLPVVACLTYHFRRDHFVEGSLINESITSGAMLRIFRRLREVTCWTYLPTTLETLFRLDCENIPENRGIYTVLAPEGMNIRFVDKVINTASLPYPRLLLEEKYESCEDKQVIYIGKASGKKGLRQRIRQYMKYGWNLGTNHRGGRAIWQIEDYEMLLLTYEPCPDCELREHQLLTEFRAKNSCYPLANWRS